MPRKPSTSDAQSEAPQAESSEPEPGRMPPQPIYQGLPTQINYDGGQIAGGLIQTPVPQPQPIPAPEAEDDDDEGGDGDDDDADAEEDGEDEAKES